MLPLFIAKAIKASEYLRAGLLLLLLPQSQEGDTGDLDDLETDTGQITDAVW